MSYTEYLRRKAASEPVVLSTRSKLDASSYTQRVRFGATLSKNQPITTEIVTEEETQVTTFAGSTNGHVNATGTNAKFNRPHDLVVDPTGTNIYVADSVNAAIRKIVISTGEVSTLAGSTSGSTGSTDATGTSARFEYPSSIVIDPSGTNLYVADRNNNSIRKIVISTAEVTTFAGSTEGYLDGIGTAAQFNRPYGITIDSTGTNLYVTDYNNEKIRKIVISTAEVSTFAGSTEGYLDGIGTAAQFSSPYGIVIDPSGTNLYVTDYTPSKIRKIVISTAEVSTFAGSTLGYLDGIGTAAQFNRLSGITIDPSGLNLYVTERFNYTIRKIVISTAEVTTIAGLPGFDDSPGNADGIGTVARFYIPVGMAFDPTGTYMYVADQENSRIRKIEVGGTFITYQTTPMPVNKTKIGRVADASAFTQYVGGQAVGREVRGADRLLLNSNSAGSLSGCVTIAAPVAPMIASQFTSSIISCHQLNGEAHSTNETTYPSPPVFVDNTIQVKNYNLPQNKTKYQIAPKCTSCGGNPAITGVECAVCTGAANHTPPADMPHNTRWAPRPAKSAQPLIAVSSPSDARKVGAALRKIPYVEKHHGNANIGHIQYPNTPYQIPAGTAAHLKINEPFHYPGTM